MRVVGFDGGAQQAGVGGGGFEGAGDGGDLELSLHWDGEDIFIMGKVLGFNEGRSENREF